MIKPVCAPDAVKPPSQVFENILSKSIAFASPNRAMVGGPIAFYGEYVAARSIRLPNSEVDQEASRTDLRIGQIAKAADYVGHVLFEWRVSIAAGRRVFQD